MCYTIVLLWYLFAFILTKEKISNFLFKFGFVKAIVVVKEKKIYVYPSYEFSEGEEVLVYLELSPRWTKGKIVRPCHFEQLEENSVEECYTVYIYDLNRVISRNKTDLKKISTYI